MPLALADKHWPPGSQLCGQNGTEWEVAQEHPALSHLTLHKVHRRGRSGDHVGEQQEPCFSSALVVVYNQGVGLHWANFLPKAPRLVHSEARTLPKARNSSRAPVCSCSKTPAGSLVFAPTLALTVPKLSVMGGGQQDHSCPSYTEISEQVP